MKSINIIDSIMGSGKTTSIINYINNSPGDSKYIYITPYLDEVKRIIRECKSHNFKQPQQYGTKINGIKYLLEKGENIATTHALFHYFDNDIIELCYSQGYTLFMDEVTDVVEPYYINNKDLDILLDQFITVNENKIIEWREDQADYSSSGKFYDIKQLCENSSLAMYGERQMMVWMFPIKIFRAFEESYILTYMFDAQMQKYYYDFYNLEYKYMHVEGNSLSEYHFVDGKEPETRKYDYSKLITIIDNQKLNLIGDINGSLSKTWYEKHKNDALVKAVKNNTYNFFNNIAKNSNTSNNLWTTFKDFKDNIKGKGYTKGFAPSNARATNEYSGRHNVAYLINKYFNPVLKNFFIENGVDVHEDRYALSEMLQFIWRSAIRDGKHITIYIPSRRMRELLISWINEQQN